jgi:hypothetical protein
VAFQRQVFDVSAGGPIAANASNSPTGNGRRSARERTASLCSPGTLRPDVEETNVEEVVKEYPHFWLIEKRGEAGDVAAKWE